MSLGRPGGHLWVSLAHPWADEGLLDKHLHIGPVGVAGQAVQVRSNSYTWVNDSIAGDGLVLRVKAKSSLEICGLALMPEPGSYVPKL